MLRINYSLIRQMKQSRSFMSRNWSGSVKWNNPDPLLRNWSGSVFKKTIHPVKGRFRIRPLKQSVLGKEGWILFDLWNNWSIKRWIWISPVKERIHTRPFKTMDPDSSGKGMDLDTYYYQSCKKINGKNVWRIDW